MKKYFSNFSLVLAILATIFAGFSLVSAFDYDVSAFIAVQTVMGIFEVASAILILFFIYKNNLKSMVIVPAVIFFISLALSFVYRFKYNDDSIAIANTWVQWMQFILTVATLILYILAFKMPKLKLFALVFILALGLIYVASFFSGSPIAFYYVAMLGIFGLVLFNNEGKEQNIA